MTKKRIMSTGDKVFATLALTLVVTLSYKFAFASTLQQQGAILGDEKSEASRVSTKSTNSNSDSGKSTNNSQSTKSETSTQKSTSNSNNNEVSTENTYIKKVEVKTQNAGTATNLQVKTETSTQKSTEKSTSNEKSEVSTDLIELSTEELSTSFDLAELEEEFGEPVTTQKTTKLEKLFLFIPVEIETNEIINQEGVTIAKKQSILGQLLDFFSF